MRASTPAHWDRYWKEHTQVEETYSNDERILSQVAHLSLGGARVLEVGAGSGRDSIEMGHRGARIFLLDYVMSSFEVIRAQAEAARVPVSCVCADGERMPFREEAFDLVFHQGLLEHFRDPMPLLRENFRVTRRGGHCLIDVPQRYHIYTIAKHCMIAVGKWFAGWETEFSPGELGGLVRSVGFEVRTIGGDWMVPGFGYRSLRYLLRKMRITLLPAYPRELPVVGPGMRRLRERLRHTTAGAYTFAMVSVLCRRPGSGAPGGEGS